MKRTTYGLIFAVALGAALRLPLLGRAELWYDEAITLLFARLPIEAMVMATAGDTHPPLWYLLMGAWRMIGGQGAAWLRLSSVICGLAAIPLAWSVTGRLGVGSLARWLVVAWLTVSPFQIYFSQEARMYALLQLLVLCAALAALTRRWVWLAVCNLLILYLHNYGLFYVPVLVGLGLIVLRQAGRLRLDYNAALAAGIVPGLLWLPWLVALLNQMATVSSGYWIEPVTAGQVIYTLAIFLFGMFTRQYVLAAVLVTVGLLAWALVRNGEHKPAWLAPVMLLAFGPFVLSIAASLAWKPIYLYRGLIGSSPFLYVFLAAPLAALPRWRRAYAAGLILPVLLAGLVGYFQDVAAFKSTTSEVAAMIESHWQPGDIVYSTNDGNWVAFAAYGAAHGGPFNDIYLMPQCEDHDRGALSDYTRQALGVKVAELEDIPHKRTWLLWTVGAPTSACNEFAGKLIVAGREPFYLYEDSNIVTSGLWLLRP